MKKTLYSAVYVNDAAEVKRLLEAGADPNSTSKYGNPPLHRTCHRGFYGIARLLIEHGADVNAVDGHGHTPLHWACERNYPTLIRLLIEHGADVNMRSRTQVHSGFTPLHFACKSSSANPGTVALLLSHGADANTLNERGETPLALATDLLDSHPAREKILDLFRQYAPEAMMEAYCSPCQGGMR